MPKSPNLSRREFVNATLGVIGSVMVVCVGVPAVAYVLGPGIKVSKAGGWVPVGKVDQFNTDEPTLVTFTRTVVNGWERTSTSYGVYVTKPASGDIYVLSNVCTHLGCHVTWQDDTKVYFCPCHDGIFSEEGLVEDGPPPSPLRRFETKVEDGTLYIML